VIRRQAYPNRDERDIRLPEDSTLAKVRQKLDFRLRVTA
jgi:hypothetical protein